MANGGAAHAPFHQRRRLRGSCCSHCAPPRALATTLLLLLPFRWRARSGAAAADALPCFRCCARSGATAAAVAASSDTVRLRWAPPGRRGRRRPRCCCGCLGSPMRRIEVAGACGVAPARQREAGAGQDAMLGVWRARGRRGCGRAGLGAAHGVVVAAQGRGHRRGSDARRAARARGLGAQQRAGICRDGCAKRDLPSGES